MNCVTLCVKFFSEKRVFLQWNYFYVEMKYPVGIQNYFQNTLYVFFKLLGFYVEVERHISDGRMDAVIQTADYIYVIEIKVDKTADVALQQIEDKHYADPFAVDSRKLFKIGINFNSSRRCIDDWKVVGKPS